MKKLMVVIGLALGMNGTVALAQHENMPGHDKMDGGHGSMPPGEHAMPGKMRKAGDAEKKQPPKPDDKKNEGHDMR